jgi:hypothetical protein
LIEFSRSSDHTDSHSWESSKVLSVLVSISEVTSIQLLLLKSNT